MVDDTHFEGVIPEGQYGAGTVLIWDAGTYANLRGQKEAKKRGEKDRGRNDRSREASGRVSMQESLEEGKVEVRLEGQKLKGGYALVRMGKGKKERWLLIKMHDDEADARRRPTKTEPESVASGRTLEEIAAEAEEEGNSGS